MGSCFFRHPNNLDPDYVINKYNHLSVPRHKTDKRIRSKGAFACKP
ncbi:hypothetical protein F0726_02329 [Acidithiobacillus caldus]|nr:hypothetical protein F0726_02329 [Acidithiobacillus caldus]